MLEPGRLFCPFWGLLIHNAVDPDGVSLCLGFRGDTEYGLLNPRESPPHLLAAALATALIKDSA